MNEPAYQVEDLRVELDGRVILEHINFAVEVGRFFAIVGPNGSGKTTLVRALYRSLLPAHGRIALLGRPLERYERPVLAQSVAVLRQELDLGFDFTVGELVSLGRSPHQALLDAETAEDRGIVEASLSACGIAALAGRSMGSISGGERQRALLARALCQRPRVLLLDEPTNHLDVYHQIAVFSAIKAQGVTVVAALHDLSLVAEHADQVLLLAGGRQVALGPPEEVLSPTRIEQVFGVKAEALRRADGHLVFGFGPLGPLG